MQKTEEEKRIFLASLQGVDIRENQGKEGPTFDDVRNRAMGITTSKDDVVSLQGAVAQQQGFGIGMGLGYSRSNT
jgi:hypothetical protein